MSVNGVWVLYVHQNLRVVVLWCKKLHVSVLVTILREITLDILCFAEGASLYNLINKSN